MSSRLRILMLGTSLETKGGVSSVVAAYLQSELASRFRITYVPTHCDGDKMDKLRAACTGYVRLLRELIFRRPDIVHIHAASRASFFRKAPVVVVSKLFRKVVVYHHHGGEFMTFYEKECPLFLRMAIKKLLSAPDVIVVLSEKWRGNFLSIDSRLPVVVLYNPSSAKARCERAGGEGRGVKILFMGRLGHEKGLHDLFHAAALLARETLDFRLVVCGDGDYPYWSQMADELGIGQYVELRGWVSGEAKADAFRSADLFALPSYNEGLPMSVLEAMSYRLPVVATPVGGIPDAVEDGVNGFLIPPGRPEVLASRLRQAILDSNLREKMGRAGCQIVLDRFELTRIVDQLSALYTAVDANKTSGN